MKQHQKVRQVISTLPSDCVSKAMAGKADMALLEDSDAVKEYICFNTYLVSNS